MVSARRFVVAVIVAAAAVVDAVRCISELQGHPFRRPDLRRVRGIKQGAYGLSGVPALDQDSALRQRFGESY